MIIPSIDIQNGRAVQLRQGRKFVLDGGDPLERLDEFAVVGEVAVIDLDAAMGIGTNSGIIRDMCRRHPIRVGGGIRSYAAAADWLDAGAAKIIIGTAATKKFCSSLPRERVIAAVDAVRGQVVVEGWQTRTGDSALDRIQRLAPYVDGFLLTQVEKEGGMSGFDLELIHKALTASAGVRITAAGGVRSAADVGMLDAMGIDAQVGMALYTGQMTLGEAVAGVLLKPVEDRFWPTVVVDTLGYSLGLVWSSKASIEAAVAERKGIYWSRSRDELWTKGATSGNTQILRRIDLDCDRDALRFTVEQTGAFCHTNSRSCWGERFDLSTLERTLVDRSQELHVESGTTKLLQNPALLKEKLGEEASELADAASVDEVEHEGADLLYFLMVALVRSGVSLERVVDVLHGRQKRISRRPMASKLSELTESGVAADGRQDIDAIREVDA